MDRVYPTDLTDEQWEILEPLLPPAKSGGRPRTVELRLVLNTIFYLNKAGCQWAMLPKDLAKRSTAHDYLSAWTADGSGVVTLWDTSDGSVTQSFPAHKASIRSVAISSDGTQAASVSSDGELHAWRLPVLAPFARGTRQRLRLRCPPRPQAGRRWVLLR